MKVRELMEWLIKLNPEQHVYWQQADDSGEMISITVPSREDPTECSRVYLARFTSQSVV